MFDIIAHSLTTRLPRSAPVTAQPEEHSVQTPTRSSLPVDKDAVQELDQAIKKMVLH